MAKGKPIDKKPAKKAPKRCAKKAAATVPAGPSMALRQAQLADICKTINRAQGGRGYIAVGADIKELEYQFVPTGIMAYDYVTNGGLIRGRIAEPWGPDGSCKTTCCAQIAASFQARGMNAMLVPLEGLDKGWWRTNGVYIPYGPKEIRKLEASQQKQAHLYNKRHLESGRTELTVAQHQASDEALDMTYEMVKANVFDLIVVDSIAMAQSSRILEKKKPSDPNEYGGNAQLVGSFTKFLQSAFNTRYDENNVVSKEGHFANRTCVVLINQARDSIGAQGFTSQVLMHPPCGRALRHAKSQSVLYEEIPGDMFAPYIKLRDNTKDAARKVRDPVARTFRNFGYKVRGGPDGRDARFELEFKHHVDEDGRVYKPGRIDNARTMRALGVQMGLIEQAASYFSYKNVHVQGKETFDALLRKDKELYDDMYAAILAQAKKDADTGTVPEEMSW